MTIPTIRIICHYCGSDNGFLLPVEDFEKPKTCGCEKCGAFLFEILEEEENKE